jgi:hypothetical protein
VKLQAMLQLKACQLVKARQITGNAYWLLLVTFFCLLSAISSASASIVFLTSTLPAKQPATGDHSMILPLGTQFEFNAAYHGCACLSVPFLILSQVLQFCLFGELI